MLINHNNLYISLVSVVPDRSAVNKLSCINNNYSNDDMITAPAFVAATNYSTNSNFLFKE